MMNPNRETNTRRGMDGFRHVDRDKDNEPVSNELFDQFPVSESDEEQLRIRHIRQIQLPTTQNDNQREWWNTNRLPGSRSSSSLTSILADPLDHRIMQTAVDAATTKYAAVQAGYFQDPHLAALMTTTTAAGDCPTPVARNRLVSVMIKRGTFGRIACIDRAIESFISLAHRRSGTNESNDSNWYDPISTSNCTTMDATAPGPTTAKVTVQVIVLGAGKDTALYRWLLHHYDTSTPVGDDQTRPSFHRVAIHWIEVDHADMINNKVQIMERYQDLFGSIETIHKGSSNNDTNHAAATSTAFPLYQVHVPTNGVAPEAKLFLVPFDLRNDPRILVEEWLLNPNLPMALDCSAPTLIISECFCMYLPDADVEPLLATMASTFSNAALCLYEPCLSGATVRTTNGSTHASSPSRDRRTDPRGGSDLDGSFAPSRNAPGVPVSAFGQVMARNLTNAGVITADSCMIHCTSLPQMVRRLQQAGWKTSMTACDLWTAYHSLLTPAQRQHAARTEFLDEWEELALMMQHYGFVVAVNNHAMCAMCETDPGNIMGWDPAQCLHIPESS